MTRFFAAVWLCLSALGAQAHEVNPAIAEFDTKGSTLNILLRLSAEPVLAGADLEGVDDTDATDAREAVDTLRALPAETFQTQLTDQALTDFARMRFVVDGAALPLALDKVEVDDVANVDLARESRLWFTASLPEGAQSLTVEWPARFGALILRQNGVDAPYSAYLTGAPSAPIALAGGAEQGFWGSLLSYIPVGFDHIVPKGLDHILFVLGLFFLSTRIGPLLWQISAFTLAHTVTLALGALGIVNIPGAIVEPIIAASIVYVAVENIWSDRLNPWRPAVIFGFGLLHGLGFASVLGEFGLPQGQFIAALIGFNIGVEVGQLAVIAVAFYLVWMVLRVAEVRMSHHLAIWAYVGLALGFAGLSYAVYAGHIAALPDALEVAQLLGFAALLCLFGALACRVPADDGAYRRYFSIPASVVIALIAFYWVVERVFL